MLGAILSHGPEPAVLPVRTIVSCVAVKQVLVPAAGTPLTLTLTLHTPSFAMAQVRAESVVGT